MAELQVVVLAVAGSSPVDHPTFKHLEDRMISFIPSTYLHELPLDFPSKPYR